MKPYTILLLRPDCVAGTFGQDTFCAHVEGETVEDALSKARASACEADEQDVPEDYYCLFCTPGHILDYQDGAGGVCSSVGIQALGDAGTVMGRLAELDRHIAQEQSNELRDSPVHPDGCYFCGGNHPSNSCTSRNREEFYEGLR